MEICNIHFVSNVFSGSISDKEIVQKSGILKLLGKGDVVMADKGFNIQDLLAIYGVCLSAPPIVRKNNVSASASTLTRRIANKQIHIEHMICKLKGFKLLGRCISLTYKGLSVP